MMTVMYSAIRWLQVKGRMFFAPEGKPTRVFGYGGDRCATRAQADAAMRSRSRANVAPAISFCRLTQSACPRHPHVECMPQAEFIASAGSKRERTPPPIPFCQRKTMSTITTKDGTQIFYNDWGTGQPVVFSHGWPLSADAFEDQMFYLASRGYRCIAHDRRGHGRSGQPWNGNDLDTYADDLAALVEKLDLKKAIHVGHSTGGGEVARYIGRHGTERVAKAVLISSVPPLMLKTAANPGGTPMDAFDQIRAGVLADRSQFFKDLSAPFYGANRPGAKVSQGLRDSFWL